MLTLNLMNTPRAERGRIRLFICALAIIVSSGCAVLDRPMVALPPPAAIVEAPKPSSADQLIDQLQAMQIMSGGDLVALREKHREAFERDASSANRLNYALAWYLTQTSNVAAADEDKLAQLIEPLATPTNTDSATRALASLLQQAALSRKKVRDDTRYALQRANTTKKEEPSREAEVRQLRARIDDLEKQLAALKSIERSVTRR
jgi:polyhydroxyalkanoate synthesis regulator phasin